MAQSLGTTVITVGSGTASGADREATLNRVAGRLEDVVAIAAEAGLTIALETHAGSLPVQPDAARELLDRCPGLRITYDPSHYIAERFPVEETLDLLKHSAHVHLRNARVGSFQETMGKGLLNMGWMVDQILASSYEGAISIEYIEDCGALQEGYDAKDEVLVLKKVLLDKGLTLNKGERR